MILEHARGVGICTKPRAYHNLKSHIRVVTFFLLKKSRKKMFLYIAHYLCVALNRKKIVLRSAFNIYQGIKKYIGLRHMKVGKLVSW